MISHKKILFYESVFIITEKYRNLAKSEIVR